MKKTLLVSALILSSRLAYSQGDGPRAFLLAPKGLWGVNAKWLSLKTSEN